MISQSEVPAADTETELEEGLATLNLSANAETDHDGRKRSVVEKRGRLYELRRSSRRESRAEATHQ